jgi:hypothetical protein
LEELVPVILIAVSISLNLLLPVIPFWTHDTNAMMGARILAKQHLGHLGFDLTSRNRHLISLFGLGPEALKPAYKLRGVKDDEQTESSESLELKKIWMKKD